MTSSLAIRQPVLYVGAHADDIELSYGASVRAHAEAQQYDIHTMIVTTGVNSGARDDFPQLSDEEFIAARRDEFNRGSRELGVKFPNQHVPALPQDDGELTFDFVYSEIAAWLSQYPNGWIKCHSDLAIPGVRHPDHVIVGQAAHKLLFDGLIVPNGLRLYVEPYQRAQFQDYYPTINLGVEVPSGISIVRSAFDELMAHDTAGFKYAIADASVHSALVAGRTNVASYYHVPR